MLTPVIACCYVQTITGHYMMHQFRAMMDEIKSHKFGRMDVMHHLLAGLKGIFTDDMMRDIDICRKSCGGAGYQSSSGFTEIFQNASPMPTYEGDNIVMLGQASRYVFKLVKRAQKNNKIPFPFEYISEMPALLATKNRGATVDECLDLNVLRNALAVRAAKQIVDCSKSMSESQQPDKVKDNEIFGDEKLAMVKAHLRHVCMNLYLHQVGTCKFKDSRIEPLLMDLARVHILGDLIKDCGAVYEAGYFAPNAHSNLKKALE